MLFLFISYSLTDYYIERKLSVNAKYFYTFLYLHKILRLVWYGIWVNCKICLVWFSVSTGTCIGHLPVLKKVWMLPLNKDNLKQTETTLKYSKWMASHVRQLPITPSAWPVLIGNRPFMRKKNRKCSHGVVWRWTQLPNNGTATL